MKKIVTLLFLLGMVCTANANWYLRVIWNPGSSETIQDYLLIEGDSGSGSATVNLTQNVEFKVYAGSAMGTAYNAESWNGNNGTMTWNSCTNWSFSYYAGVPNCKLTIGFEGDYVFTFDKDNMKVSVTYPTKTIYFYDNLEWHSATKDAIYLYLLDGDYWNVNGSGSSGKTEVKMTQVSTSNIWKADISCNNSHVAFVKNKQTNYSNFYETEAVYKKDFSASTPLFVPNTTSTTTLNGTKYYSDDSNVTGDWYSYPYTRDVTSGNFGTLCLPIDADITGATVFTITSAYKVNNVFKGVNLESVLTNSIEAGKSYIFKATSSKLSASFKGTTYAEPTTAWYMTGNLSSTPTNVAINDYIIKDNQLRKVVSEGVATVPKNRAYISSSVESYNVSSARGIYCIDFDDESTGIEEIEAIKNVGNETFYNLAGQRVAQPTKGLYIVNGKKVLRK